MSRHQLPKVGTFTSAILGTFTSALTVETEETVRVDSTMTETHILEPSDSRLLYDGVRVLTRLLRQAQQTLGADAVACHDHCRAAKRRTLEIQSQRGKARCAKTYRKLMFQRHIEHYGAVKSRVAFDGGYASRANLKDARKLGIEHVVFNKKRGLKVADMTPSSWLYGQLKRFRAGIEAGISYLKRCFGLGRCLWRGLPHFTAYVQSAVFAHNLMRLARLHPKPGLDPLSTIITDRFEEPALICARLPENSGNSTKRGLGDANTASSAEQNRLFCMAKLFLRWFMVVLLGLLSSNPALTDRN